MQARAKAPRKTYQKPDDGWKGLSVTSDVLNLLSTAEPESHALLLASSKDFLASAILLIKKGICYWES